MPDVTIACGLRLCAFPFSLDELVQQNRGNLAAHPSGCRWCAGDCQVLKIRRSAGWRI